MTERMEDVEGVVRGAAIEPPMNWKQRAMTVVMAGLSLTVVVCIFIALLMLLSRFVWPR
jgi:hypothetical protein